MNKIIRLVKNIIVNFKFRNNKFLSEGTGCVYKYWKSFFPNPENISLGNNVYIGPACMFDGAGGIRIGCGTIFAPEVLIYSRTHNFDRELSALPFDNVMLTSQVEIGDYVWIGTRTIILPGVSIGKGAVIGAGSVVSRNIPEYAVAVGNPARAVRFRDQVVFEKLYSEEKPFVYTRHGHCKIFKKKIKQT